MGRKCKPTQLKLVENSRDRRAKSKIAGEPVPKGTLSDAPDWLSDDEKEVWDYAIAHAPLGLLKMIDSETLASWAIAATIRREALRKLRASSLLVKGSKGSPVISPFLRVVNGQAVLMKGLAAELGFTPAARTGIAIEEQEIEDRTIGFFPTPGDDLLRAIRTRVITGFSSYVWVPGSKWRSLGRYQTGSFRRAEVD